MSLPTSQFNQITIRVRLPQDQAELIYAAMQRWMLEVPTVYFLDICSIGHIKTYLKTGEFKDARHEASIQELQKIDIKHNAVSYLPALMEKASDQRSKFSAETFIVEARRDWNAMSAFFKSAQVYEPWEFVEAYATDLFGAHPEQSNPAYLAFLQFANDQGLHNKTTKQNRLRVAQVLCTEAQKLGISTGHPVVLVPIACIYGCLDAQKVMKFSAKPGNFNPGNALGDIQSISRVGGILTNLIQRAGASGGRFMNGQFVTSDSPLYNMLRCFTVGSVNTTETPDGATHRISISVDAPRLYPDLFGADREPKDDESRAELAKLYELLGAGLTE